MKKRKLLMIFAGIFGAIAIGAIGSGVWKHMIEPAVFKSRDIILNITVLGFEKYKDAIYKEVARGFHEAPSIELYTFFNIIFIIAFVCFCLFLIVKAREVKQDSIEVLSKIKCIIDGKEKEVPSLDDLYNRASSYPIKTNLILISSAVSLFLAILLSTFIISEVVRLQYINSAISHFDQMHHIVRPYLLEKQENFINSKFAQISNKQNYVDLISELEKVADSQNLYKPEFSVW